MHRPISSDNHGAPLSDEIGQYGENFMLSDVLAGRSAAVRQRAESVL
ncbi:hypothetical protein [Burkholderia sp. Ac-20379]|nr:hypothetical protein [Burkholderia sp. Ac-20379]MBN3723605.1 hypothetical protein [Burkholderia sp. Ac-20379]